MGRYYAGVAKPAPRVYELATNGLGIKAEHCLFVGDGSDGEPACSARLHGVALLAIDDSRSMQGPRERYFLLSVPLTSYEDLGLYPKSTEAPPIRRQGGGS